MSFDPTLATLLLVAADIIILVLIFVARKDNKEEKDMAVIFVILVLICNYFIYFEYIQEEAWYIELSNTVITPWQNGKLSDSDVNRYIGAMQEKDRKRFFDVIFRKSVPGTEKLLIYTIEASGDKGLAVTLLNSGSAQLSAAAREWATRNGYNIETVVVPKGVTDRKW